MLKDADHSAKKSSAPKKSSPRWPTSIDNWHAFESGAPWLAIHEFPLFTDAWIIGETNLGPYSFLNTFANTTVGTVRPGMVLRYATHKEFEFPDLSKTDDDQYHGGTVQEEIAALASLALGIRLRAGPASRNFVPGGDPLGSPDHFGVFFPPQVNVEYRPILPNAFGKHTVDALKVLQQITVMDHAKAMALVRAARMYQDFLWLVESVPELAWLLLVSALEAAANDWRKDRGDSAERLKLSNSRLYNYLESLPDSSILPTVAGHLAESLGLTNKFVDFIVRFLPDPPAPRALERAQFTWTEKNLRRAFRVIYGYRSDALHAGKPFPRAMSEAPHRETIREGFSEIMTSLAVGQQGGIWLKKDIPMNLHLFEYIARSALLNWWRSEQGRR